MSSYAHYVEDVTGERGSAPLDIDNIHVLLQVEQEQIQKRTFTNWVNAQLAKRRPPCMVSDLFNDFRDGSKLLDLLEVMSNQRMSRERGRGTFHHRSNIEKALAFLRQKSIKLVNINIPDIIDGKPSIILGLVWTIILQYHIEELASVLSFNSRQSSMESLASLDSRSTLSCGGPAPRKGSPLHARFRVSAKKALLLWVREQCHKAGCSVNVKDFKGSWRSGVVFLAILYALRSDLVDLSKARTRSNKQNLEEAFRVAERELKIPRLLEPDDVDVREPDEKSIMTYVAQFLQYSRDLPMPEEDFQIIFRKISDVKKEEEERQRAKNEVQLTIPQDHPVRKLFQKFKQQKELRNHGCGGAASSQSDVDKNQHLHAHGLQLGHSSLQRAHLQNGAPPSSSVLTVSQVVYSETPAKQNDALDLRPAEQSVSLKVCTSPPPAHTTLRTSGWMRLKSNVAPPEARRLDGLNNKAVSVEMLSQEVKVQERGQGGDIEEGGVSGANPLRKTDSCDSGITKSELRIDRAGEARTPAATTPFLHSPPSATSPHPFCPIPEQALQAALHETRLELREDIHGVCGRLGALEGQVAEIITLLSDKRRSSMTPPIDPAPTPKTKIHRQDIFTVSRPVSPDSADS